MIYIVHWFNHIVTYNEINCYCLDFWRIDRIRMPKSTEIIIEHIFNTVSFIISSRIVSNHCNWPITVPNIKGLKFSIKNQNHKFGFEIVFLEMILSVKLYHFSLKYKILSFIMLHINFSSCISRSLKKDVARSESQLFEFGCRSYGINGRNKSYYDKHLFCYEMMDHINLSRVCFHFSHRMIINQKITDKV